MTLAINVDKDVCLSSSRCVLDEPEAFRFDDDELAEATPAAAELPEEQLLAVARACPSGAIQVLRDGIPVSN